MWEAIRSNRRRSWVLIALMGTILVVLGASIGAVVDPSAAPIGAMAALAVWMIMLVAALVGGRGILIASSGARRIEKEMAPQLFNVVEEMTIASGLGKMPDVYIIEDPSPNAFAMGLDPDHAALAVTSGLLARLNRDELQGVVAHEIGHIDNLDIRFMTIASVLVGSTIMISEVFLRSMYFASAGRRRSSSKGGGQAQAIFLVIALVMAILAPLAAQALYFACSRRREYLADASAARFTRYPAGLASALEKISGMQAGGEKSVSRALAPMYIVNPLTGLKAMSLFSTHPPTEKRVEVLRAMGGMAGYKAYEAAYEKVAGGRGSVIGSRTLSDATDEPARAASTPKDARGEAVERARQATDVLDRLANYLFLPCVCGLRIKLPPESDLKSVTCPRCGRKHETPTAESMAAAVAAAKSAAGGVGQDVQGESAEAGDKASAGGPMRHHRRAKGEWESFKCDCGATIQLSPIFAGKHVRCGECKKEIEIV